MSPTLYLKVLFVCGLAGVLFSGYLSGIKYFTSVCAFNEPCPYFLGYPACWYGFAMFTVIFIAAILGVMGLLSVGYTAWVAIVVSFLGILFAGYFTIPEIQKLISGAVTNYTLILPTCAYGLIFYILVFAVSAYFLKSAN